MSPYSVPCTLQLNQRERIMVKLDKKTNFRCCIRTILVACKNKISNVTPLKVTKSDCTIGFSVIDLVENKVWFMDFLLAWCFFSRLKSKSRVSVPKFCKQLDCQISTTIVFLERSTQTLSPDKISGWYDVISGCPMTSFKILNFGRKSKKQPKMAIYYISFVTSLMT